MLDIVLVGSFLVASGLVHWRYSLKGLGENIPSFFSRGTHIASGYLFAALGNLNPVAAIGLFVLFLTYQLYDAFKIEEDPKSFLKDIFDFAIGIAIWAIKNGLNISITL